MQKGSRPSVRSSLQKLKNNFATLYVMLLCIYAHVYSKQLYLVLPYLDCLSVTQYFLFWRRYNGLKQVPITTDMEPTFPVNLLLKCSYISMPVSYVIKYVDLTIWTSYLRYVLQTSPLSIFTNNRLINFLKEALNKTFCVPKHFYHCTVEKDKR